MDLFIRPLGGHPDRVTSSPSSPRTRVVRNPGRAHYDAHTLEAVLDAGYVAHVAFAVDGQPFCIPMAYVRVSEKLYLHGATSSRLVKTLAGGAAACVTVTHVDGLVLARSAFHHSMNYRSAVCFGRVRTVDALAEKAAALDAFVDRMASGRAAEVRRPNERELRATTVLALALGEASVKIRTGDPIDEPDDLAWPCWAGVIPMTSVCSAPQPSADLHGDHPPPRG